MSLAVTGHSGFQAKSEAKFGVSAWEGVDLKSSGFGVQCAAFSEPFLARLFSLPGRLLALRPSRSPHPHPRQPLRGLWHPSPSPTGPLPLRGHTGRPLLLLQGSSSAFYPGGLGERRTLQRLGFSFPKSQVRIKYLPWGPGRGHHSISHAANARGLLAFPLSSISTESACRSQGGRKTEKEQRVGTNKSFMNYTEPAEVAWFFAGLFLPLSD